MDRRRWATVRDAWDEALYGPAGFYLTQRPADHFRTSAHASPVFAEAIVALVRSWRLEAVVDLGAGSGELLTHVHALAPDLELEGIDLRGRPVDLPASVGWRQVLSTDPAPPPAPGRDRGVLVLANELLDNVACEVAELGDDGVYRIVEVDTASGLERLGAEADADTRRWLAEWWPLHSPGERADVGRSRDDAWASIVGAWPDAVCVAVDYGHRRTDRPPGSTLASYRRGRQQVPTFDRAHDLTADVAVDAVAARVGAEVVSQRRLLHDLGLWGARPSLEHARTAPTEYIRALGRATEIAELTASPGLGDFWWIISPAGLPVGEVRRTRT